MRIEMTNHLGHERQLEPDLQPRAQQFRYDLREASPILNSFAQLHER
jgi:hypothetical protein